MKKSWRALAAALIMSIVLAFMAITPPRPQGLETSADQFSSARAMVDLRRIAAAPHPTGSDEIKTVRRYLEDRLSALGLTVSLDEGLLDERALARLNRWSGTDRAEQIFQNIIGVRRGSDPSLPALLLMAHYDTVWGSPGAADDSIGIAAILEILRALNTENAAARNVIVLFTDAEEIGLVGARHFFKTHPLKDRIGAVINLEARGGGGKANLFQTSKNNGALARHYARTVKSPSASSLSTFVYDILPNDTDLTPALKKEYVAYNIANIGKAEYYHSPKITVKALDEATLAHMGGQALDLTRALITADELPKQSKDAVFFDVFGLFILVYAPFWGWIFLSLSAAFFTASIDGRWRGKDILIGCGKMTAFLAGGGALLYGLNWLSGHGSSADYYDRLAAIPKLEVLACLFVIGFGALIFGRKRMAVNMRLGAALPLLIIGLVGQALAPTATYFISLPLMLCGLAAWAAPHGKGRVIIAIIVAALSTGYMLGLSHLLMLGVGAQLLFVVVLPAALAILALSPLSFDLPKGVQRLVMLLGIGGAVAFALWVRLDPIATTVPLY